MSETQVAHDTMLPQVDTPAARSLLRRKLPYILLLAVSIVGIAFTNFSHQPLNGFWEFLAIATCIVCIATAWPQAPDRKARFRLIWTQALHWVTVLVTMNIVLMPGFQTLLPIQASSLVILMLFAFGTFLAGINLLSWEIAVLGLALAASVPAIVWVKQSALFLLLAVLVVIGAGIYFWPGNRKKA